VLISLITNNNFDMLQSCRTVPLRILDFQGGLLDIDANFFVKHRD
jgi:hypothetical protein